jgi:hypothetical protein
MAGLSMLLWFSSDLLSGVTTLVANTSVTLVSMVLLWNADRAMASTPMNSTVTRAD